MPSPCRLRRACGPLSDAGEAAEMKQAEQAALLRAKDSPPVKEPPPADPAIEDPARPQDKRKRDASH